MSCAQRERDANDSSPPAQLKHLAFNIRGYAMRDGMAGSRGLHEVICAYEKSTFYIKDLVKEAMEDAGDVQYFRKDAAYTKRELDEPGVNIKQYLVVGYAPRDLPQHIEKRAPWQKNQRPVGVTQPPTIFEWDEEKIPMLVVTEILPKQSEGTKLWALMKPKNGLCIPYQIAQDYVFYRWEFRDYTTNIRTRGPNWNAKVTTHAVRPGLGGGPLSEKQEKSKRAKNATSLAFNPNISVADEIAHLATCYEKSQDWFFAEKILAVLKHTDEDLNCRPPPENNGLRLFVEKGEEISQEEAEQAVGDFRALWPKVENISAENIVVLKQYLISLEVEVEYRLLKPFIAEACWRLNNRDSGFNGYNMVKEVVEIAGRMMGPVESAPSNSITSNTGPS